MARLRLLALVLSGILAACASAPTDAKKPPNDEEKARMLVDVANGALMEGDPTGALYNLAAAEKLNPDLPEIHHSRALAYHAKHDDVQALLSARRAVSIAPKYSDARNTLGRLLMDTGKSAEAIVHLKSAATDALYRDAFKAQTNLGILYYRQGDLAQATQHLDIAIRDASVRACHAYYYRGHISLRQGKFEEATRNYDKATQKFCASFADAHLALGIAYERGRQYDRARKKFLSVKDAFPGTKVADQATDRLKYLP